jgi:hypothetical protein
MMTFLADEALSAVAGGHKKEKPEKDYGASTSIRGNITLNVSGSNDVVLFGTTAGRDVNVSF